MFNNVKVIILTVSLLLLVGLSFLFIYIKKPFDFQKKVTAPGCDWAYIEKGEVHCVADVEASEVTTSPENFDLPATVTPVIQSETNK